MTPHLHAHFASYYIYRCTPDDLLEILALVDAKPNVDATLETVAAARRKLDADCFRWDCSVGNPKYPEFCHVRAFLG